MFDASLQFPASVTPGPGITYQVQWLYGKAGGPLVNAALVTIPETTSGDLTGYSSDFDTDNPTITLGPTDIVDAKIVAVQNGLSSAPVTAPPATVPTPPPTPPAAPASATIIITGP